MSRRNLEVGVDGVAKVQFIGMDVVGWMLEDAALMRWMSCCRNRCRGRDARSRVSLTKPTRSGWRKGRGGEAMR